MANYDIKKKLGERIKFLRREKNFTQEFFAEQIDIEPQSLSNIERGKFAPSLETLQKIANVLNVEPYELYLFDAINPIELMRRELNFAINVSDSTTIKLYKYLDSMKTKTIHVKQA